ncbi:MAG: DUF308 domain-containing protein [Clostridia bacterium]|nr:DUF308 domain-containing protein [Clostridia bacterium]
MAKIQGKSRISWVQICWGWAALLLVCGSILSFATDGDRLLRIATPLGVIMLFAGLCNVLVYRKKRGELHGAPWLLADGMSTAMLSLFLLFNQMIIPTMIPFFFGVWELFSGILKFIDSRELKREGVHGWVIFFAISIIELVSGVAALLRPIEEFFGMNYIIGIILLVQCSGFVFKTVLYPNFIKRKS